jgi:hypothetical protein
VGQGEQGLPAGVEAPPSGSPLVRRARMSLARWFRLRVDNGIAAG